MSGGRVKNGIKKPRAVAATNRGAKREGCRAQRRRAGASGVSLVHTAAANKTDAVHQHCRAKLDVANNSKPTTNVLLCAFHMPGSATSTPSARKQAVRSRL